MNIETLVLSFLRSHVNIVIPLAIMALRLVVLRLAGDMKEMFRTLFSVPMDLVFISISLVLAGLARTIPGFANRYQSPSEADLAGTVLLLALIVIAVFFSYIDRFNRVVAESFHVALQQIKRFTEQPEFKWKEPSLSVGFRLVFAVLYLVVLVLAFGLELVFSIAVLSYVLQQMG